MPASSRPCVACAVVLLAAAGCRSGVEPSKSACGAAFDRVIALGSNGDPGLAEALERRRVKYVTGCLERMTMRQAQCVAAAKSVDETWRCEPEVDRRPPAERPSAERCGELAARYDALLPAATGERSASVRRALIDRTRRTCLTTQLDREVRCQIAAATVADLQRCEP